MALAKAFENLGNSILGKNAKAVLCIRDPKTVKDKDTRNEKGLSNNLLSTIKAITGAEGALMDRVASALGGNGSTSKFNEIRDTVERNGFIALELQYNPASLRLDTSAGMQRSRETSASGIAKVSEVEVPASTTLVCDIVFDDMNLQDAFMTENIAPSVGNVLSAIKNVRSSGFSVQKQVDGFISMLMRDETRQVNFFWANMCFRGEVTNIDSHYTMFNKKGNPIRATVNMTIRQGSGSQNAKSDKKDDSMEAALEYNDTYWDKAVDRCFGKKDEQKEVWADK